MYGVIGRGGVNGHYPNCCCTEVFDVIQFGYQSRKVANAIAIAVAKGLDEYFIYDISPGRMRVRAQLAE